jgi:glycerate 2-kinase
VKPTRNLRADAFRIWNASIHAVDPALVVGRTVVRKGLVLGIGRRRIRLDKWRHVWLLGAGKAAPPMARALENILGKRLDGGILVTKHGHSLPLRRTQCLEAGHPLPDRHSVTAARRMERFVESRICPDDLVIFALSGGASSLLVSPAPGIRLEDKIRCTRALLRAGADIYELNAIRKHLSTLKGGGLARLLAPATVICLILSDVVGDDIGTIASGLLAPDVTTYADCLKILRRLEILDGIPAAVLQRLESGAAGNIPETPKPGDPAFKNCWHRVAAGNAQACSAAVQTARKLGYQTMLLTSRLTGDTREVARFHMNIVEEINRQQSPAAPACLPD